MSSTRRRRETIQPRTEDVGPVWLVRGAGREEHVRAEDIDGAIDAFVMAVSTTEVVSREQVTQVIRIAVVVHSLPRSMGGSDGAGRGDT